MNHTTHNVDAQRKPDRESRRRGTVLILVVVLIVLLALMGTAYLSTVRIDRTASRLSVGIGQSDELLDSLVRQVQASLIDDLPQNPTALSAESFDHPEDDLWLADRLPEWSTALTWPQWRYLSNLDPSAPYVFHDPFQPTPIVATGTSKSAYAWAPTAVTKSDGQAYPALRGFTLGGGTPTPWPGAGTPLMAADADGDGVADAPYYKLPGRIGDITYYAGIRIIDNNSAINVNTAWNRDYDLDFSSGLMYPLGFFTGNVGFGELLRNYVDPSNHDPEIYNVNRYRFGFPGVPWSAAAPYLLATGDQNAFKEWQGGTPPAPTGAPLATWYYSQSDALWAKLGSRIDNPGHRNATTRFRSYPITEMMRLAHRFVLKDPTGKRGLLEGANLGTGIPWWGIPESLFDHPNIRNTPYAASDAGVEAWFTDNFNFYNVLALGGTVPPPPIRSLLVTHNSTSVQSPGRPGLPAGAAGPAGYTASGPAPRRSVNQIDPTNHQHFVDLVNVFFAMMLEADGSIPTDTNTRMFRHPFRTVGGTPPVTWTEHDQVHLRAALAAVNTLDLLDADHDVTAKTIEINGTPVTVYGTEKIAVISEAVVYLDGGSGWIGIELHSPYTPGLTGSDPPLIDLTGWQLAIFDRANTTNQFTVVHTFLASDPAPQRTITHGGYLTIVSDASTAATAVAGVVLPAEVVQADNLDPAVAVGKELVLLRPRLASGAYDPALEGSETAPFCAALVPVDQIDLRNFSLTLPDPTRYRYARTTGSAQWMAIYPHAGVVGPGTPLDRGFIVDGDPATTPSAATFGAADAATYSPQFQIPLNDLFWPGFNVPAANATFPFGRFARNGDLLMIPFIGAYTIGPITPSPGGPLHEMNPVTIDAAYAEEATAVDNGQFVGRFCPLGKNGVTLTGYEWTSRLFDFLTTHQNPATDTLPNAFVGNPQPVANGPVMTVENANKNNELNAGVHGLININTAPVPVLNMLLLKEPSTTDPTHELTNRAIAAAIYDDRIGTPYRRITDLLRVAEVRQALGDPGATDFPLITGDITPGSLTETDGVVDDFEQHYMPLTRLSNLITTRSDSFTVYIVLEGWRNAGTVNAERVTQRRAAYIMDRSGYTPTNQRVKITHIPVE